MKAIILSAGRGGRLLPLTKSKPKCLLELDENFTVLRWQLARLEEAGVREIVVVTGFHAELVEAEIANHASDITIRTMFNPFFQVADNLATLWLVRAEMDEDFIVLNGDTIFTTDVAKALIAGARAPITLTVAVKEDYDDDDMKAILDDGRLRRVSKKLSAADANAESIGFMLFQGGGVHKFRDEVTAIMREPEGLKRFYLSVIDNLASEIEIGTVQIETKDWQEIDYPDDYTAARHAVRDWVQLMSARQPSGLNGA